MAKFDKNILGKKEIKEIICYECGQSMEPNAINLCEICIQTTFDFSKLVSKTAELEFCSKCDRYLDPPNTWIKAAAESQTLFRICLKKLRFQSGAVLVDHRFIWTEPHCKGIKLELNVKIEAAQDFFLKQLITIEFIICGHMCDHCHRIQAKDFWSSKVQIRQDLDHKKTFYYLEQLMIKIGAAERALNVKKTSDGVDLFFSHEQHASHFVDFVVASVPCKVEKSKKLRSHDIQSGVYDYKHTTLITIVPVCKDNVVCLPPKLANEVGQISQLCLVLRVNSQITLIDPLTAQVGDLNTASYWRHEFKPLCSTRKILQYMVIEIDRNIDNKSKKVSDQKKQKPTRRFKGKISNKHSVVEVWLQKSSEVGCGDLVFARTHLGNLLKEGDTVQGYDLKNSNTNDVNFDKLKEDRIPDIIIVKKILNPNAPRKRSIHLRHLAINDDLNSLNNDYMDFLDDLEEDDVLRDQLTIYNNAEDALAAEGAAAEDKTLAAVEQHVVVDAEATVENVEKPEASIEKAQLTLDDVKATDKCDDNC